MVKFINGFCGVIKKLCHYLCYICMVMVACMMILMFVDAFLGLFFNSRVLGSYEIVQCMLCLVVFTSWAYTQTVRGHIHVVMFIKMMGKRLRFICFTIVSLLSAVVMGIASYAVYQAIFEKMASNEKTAILLIPIWPLYLIECVAIAVFALALFGDALKSLFAIFNDEVAEDVMSSWT